MKSLRREIKYPWPVMAVLCVCFAGCSAVRWNVVPTPQTIQSNFTGSCGEAVVQKFPEGPESREYSSNVSDFIVNLEKSGLVRKVYYHIPPKEPVPLSLELHFKESTSRHPIVSSIKSVAGIMSFGILFAVLRYDRDYVLEARMNIYKNEKEVKTAKAKASAHWSGTFLDTANTPIDLKIQGLGESVYKQLLADLSVYCSETNSRGQ